jgi:glycosyltransferase involved in cell wall biosynthesis
MPNTSTPAPTGLADQATGASHSSRKLRLCVMATIGKSIQVLYAGRLEYFVAQGFDITVVCASSDLDDAIRARGVRLVTMPLTRAITPLSDLRAVLALYRFFRKERFDVIEVSTPKAALVGSLAAWLARSRCVVHLLQGLAYEGKSGLQGAALRASTWIPCRLADITVAISNSLREQVIADGMGTPESIKVLGPGTVNGLDFKRFTPEKCAERETTRAKYNIAPHAVVLGFVGRMTRDKGIEELSRAFDAVHREFSDTVLLIVGDYEERDCPSHESIAFVSTHPNVRHVGWQNDVVPFMAAMDIFVLPTHREGLGVVLLEAAALGIPSVTTNATGARDAVIDGTTGLRVPVGDVPALVAAINRLVRDSALRETFGRAGREWVCKNFNQKEVWQRQVDAYGTLVSNG